MDINHTGSLWRGTASYILVKAISDDGLFHNDPAVSDTRLFPNDSKSLPEQMLIYPQQTNVTFILENSRESRLYHIIKSVCKIVIPNCT